MTVDQGTIPQPTGKDPAYDLDEWESREDEDEKKVDGDGRTEDGEGGDGWTPDDGGGSEREQGDDDEHDEKVKRLKRELARLQKANQVLCAL